MSTRQFIELAIFLGFLSACIIGMYRGVICL